jgi:hypothetical protein
MFAKESKDVTVRVPENLNLEQSKQVLVNVLAKVGHPYCFSGFKIGFEIAVHSINDLTVDRNSLEARETVP